VLGRELPQHVMQDAAVLEIFELVERIDAAGQGYDGLIRTIGLADLDREFLEMLGRPFLSAAASE
jgi:hypothetical protein